MASSSDSKEYPPRLHQPGKSPLQEHSFNYGCHLTDFGKCAIRSILKLATRGYVWSSHMVHQFIANQLAVDRQYEVWSLIGGRPLRFSLHEFAEITRFNCDPIVEDGWDIDHTEFWAEMGVKTFDGPNWNELDRVIDRCQTWSEAKKKMVAKLLLLHVGIFGLNRNSRVPLKCAKRVLDEDTFESYPWGRHAFKHLVESIKVACLDGDTYFIHGFVHAYLIWAFESVPIFGEKIGRRWPSHNPNEIPLLRWRSSRKRFRLETVINEEKQNTPDNKVCKLMYYVW
ncbi:hypothetical protein EUTSA_v10003373mg [Eutrema salsugineum]|uniref:DUF1985 domain-containing protein n=1 Tax=Eutrema salsugineum TaxID=72664 RepID=V4L332_EUTSA|nr:hypothetical protein EUTSA_v10003373mg [Eutrema salsugineum]